MTTDPWLPVKRLQPGDTFGPVVGDNGAAHTVATIVRVGKRNLYDVTDTKGATYRTGGERCAGDCYGWQLRDQEAPQR